MIRILYFARLRELLGTGEEHLELSAHCNSVADLREMLCRRGPEWSAALNADGLFVAVNQTVVDETRRLTGDEEVAFFPPVTGG